MKEINETEEKRKLTKKMRQDNRTAHAMKKKKKNIKDNLCVYMYECVCFVFLMTMLILFL